MTEAIDFTKQFEFKVEVFDHALGKLGSGTLHFGPERWTQIKFDIFEDPYTVPEGKVFRVLKAKTQTNEYFTLFNCKRIYLGMVASYVITGEIGENIKSIDIRYSDISEWYLAWQRLDGNVGDTISWKNPANHLAATVETSEHKFAITSKSETSITQSGEDHIIHEHVLFCFQCLDGYFSPEDVQAKALELSNLLSILISYPLSINSIQVVCENNFSHSAIFSTFKRVEREASDSNFFLRCFIDKKSIHSRWESIFNRHFNSDFRKVSWTRLAGMQRYEGFWEYRALGYVTLLDKYVDQRYRESGCREKIEIPHSIRAKAKLNTAMKKLKPPLEVAQSDSLMTFICDAFANKREFDFSEKYQRVISTANPDMIRIINISDEDFKLIKKVRDKIAHGEALGMLDDDFGRIDSIVSKIELLLTYWAFLDFGLTDDDFLRCLNTTHNPLRNRAQPDEMHIDRMTKPETFFSVSKENFDKFSGAKGIRVNACFTQSTSGIIEYSDEYSMAYKNWQNSADSRSGGTKHADIFGVAQERITYLVPMYIECGDECLQLPIAWVIKDVGSDLCS